MDVHVILTAALRLRTASPPGAYATRDVHIVNHSSWETAELALAVRDILTRCEPGYLAEPGRVPLTLVFVGDIARTFRVTEATRRL